MPVPINVRYERRLLALATLGRLPLVRVLLLEIFTLGRQRQLTRPRIFALLWQRGIYESRLLGRTLTAVPDRSCRVFDRCACSNFSSAHCFRDSRIGFGLEPLRHLG